MRWTLHRPLRAWRGHEQHKNFFLSTIHHLSYDNVDLFAPIPILAQETDDFINDNQNNMARMDRGQLLEGVDRQRRSTTAARKGRQSEDDLARRSRGRIAGKLSSTRTIRVLWYRRPGYYDSIPLLLPAI
ncbi:BQ5605_C035g11454 [Microbotryum silenes-dioicae]|uniref:BQ5605_C035g11454 protein n=1 Tax=Microbotryum silenes-dioicae TaxID=796604 RepID=A0A2X0MKA0_9BASI|nr:BQ5605_C035g11454 [Microbotryum silenes-dioicae]